MSDYRLFDSFQDAVLVIDSEINVFFGNIAATLLFEVSSRRLAGGKPLSHLISFEPDPVAALGDLDLLDQATQVKEVAFSASSGKEGWAQVSIQPQPSFFAEGPLERKRFIVSLRDVTLEKTLFDKYKAELDKKERVIQDLQIARGKLEDYSKNLEKRVEERTIELSEANLLLKTVLDSLGQGILVFDPSGTCLPIYSKVCRTILEVEPGGRNINDVLRLAGEDESSFQSWREAVFGEMLDFEDLIPLAPNQFKHSRGLHITLNYNPLRDEGGALHGVVVVATDITSEMEAKLEAARERQSVRKIVQVARHREAFARFITDSRELLRRMNHASSMDLEDVARGLHTLKGGAATFSLDEIVSSCHALEEQLKRCPAQPQARAGFFKQVEEESGRIHTQLDGEIAALTELLGPLDMQGVRVVEVPKDKFAAWGARLLNASDMREARTVGMEIVRECHEKPIGELIQPLEPALRSLAESMGKSLSDFRIEGGDVRAPVASIQSLMSSLVHAYRNAVDHGLETPDERRESGKSPAGTIGTRVREYNEEGRDWLCIEIYDDGRGVDPSRVRKKVAQLGLSDWADQSDDDVIQAILRSDLSTAEKVTEISGRGVGLSAVAQEARKLGGSVRVHSDPGLGMRLEIRVPIPSRDWGKIGSAA